MPSSEVVKHYFVDETGDLVLFDDQGEVVVGNKGVSRYFMVGLVELPNPSLAHQRLEELRQQLMADPFFNTAPSMQPEEKKTAVYFHAKDDLPEVKYEVIKLLPSLDARVTIGIKRKEHLAKLHKPLPGNRVKKLAPNTVYDELITEIFRDHLPPAAKINLVFARRGRRERRKALQEALAAPRSAG